MQDTTEQNIAHVPPENTTPASLQTHIGTLNFERGYPTEETTRKVFDEIDYQRAAQA